MMNYDISYLQIMTSRVLTLGVEIGSQNSRHIPGGLKQGD